MTLTAHIRRFLAAPKKGGGWPKGRGRFTLTQLEIDVMAEYATGYPLEEASGAEQAAWDSAMAKLKKARSDRPMGRIRPDDLMPDI